MSSAATLETARFLAIDLERREKHRGGGTRDEVRRRVATRIRIAPGTLETLRRGRLKRLEVWVFARLARAAIADLKTEMRRDEARLAIARRCAGHLAETEAAALEEGLGELRRALAALEACEGSADGPANPAGREGRR